MIFDTPKLAKLALCATLFCAAAATPATAEMRMLPGEVSKFELPRFDEKTGAKLWEIFGDRAKFLDGEKIDVLKVKLDLFDKATAKRRAEILSDTALVEIASKTATSQSELRVNGDAFDIKGKRWRWDGEHGIVEIFSDVEINFNPAEIAKNPDSDAAKLERTTVFGDRARLENGGDDNKFFVSGNAKVRSQSLSVDCDSIEVHSGGNGAKNAEEISSIFAVGNVVMSREGRTAKAARAEIFPRRDEAVLTGSPEIEDSASKAKLSGDKILFLKEAKSLKTSASRDGKIRAKTLFFHTGDNGETQKIEIFADKILMSAQETQNRFDFNGNVRVSGDGFTAKCGNIVAFAKNVEAEKPEVKIIKGYGGVHLKNDDGDAYANELYIYPKEAKTSLSGGVKLVNGKDGTTLEADTLELFKNENYGTATARKNGFVKLTISENAADLDALAGATPAEKPAKKASKSGKASAKPNKPKNGESVVKARVLYFERRGDTAKFVFDKDVSILSKNVVATCGQMNVYSVSKADNSSRIAKIEAFDAVRVIQNEYTASAEKASIYPKNNEPSSAAKSKAPHKFVELSVWEKKPNVRPKILLPAMRNLGFENPMVSRKTKPRMTVVVSDRQWLDSSADGEKYCFAGNVKITATDTDGACDKIEIAITPPENGKRREISDIMLSGNVKMTQGEKEISCGRARIYAKDEVAVLTENPVIFNREDNTRAAGAKIVYNKGSKLVSIQNDDPAHAADSDEDFSDISKKRPSITLPEFNLKKPR